MAQKTKIINRFIALPLIIVVAVISLGYKDFDPWAIKTWTDDAPRAIGEADTTPTYFGYTRDKSAYYRKAVIYWRAVYDETLGGTDESLWVQPLYRPFGADSTQWCKGSGRTVPRSTNSYIFDTLEVLPCEQLRFILQDTWSSASGSLSTSFFSVVLLNAEK